MKFKLVEEFEDVSSLVEAENKMLQAIKDYRSFANIEEDFQVTEENIDKWALNEAACKHAVRGFDLKKALIEDVTVDLEAPEAEEEDNDDDKVEEKEEEILTEDVTIDQAAREAEAEVETANTKSQIEDALDKSLKRARKVAHIKGADYPNILLVGDAGSGKSAIVRQWAKENGINLVYKDIKTITPTDLGGMKMRDPDDPHYAMRVGSKEFINALDKPNSVLFLDEYNRAKTEVRGTLLTLMNEHVAWDPTAEGEERFLPNFLFTIMAINPATGAYPGARDLDPAERSRARKVSVQMIPEEHLRFLEKAYAKELAEAADEEEKLEIQGRLEIARKLLTDKSFTYDSAVEVLDMHDDPNWIPLNYRSLKKLLDETNGTKKDFLDNWSDYCNYKKKGLVQTILSDYVDVQDKANQALAGGTGSKVFGNSNALFDQLADMFPELNED